jgi:uncharacterized protein (TIGR00255 family)
MTLRDELAPGAEVPIASLASVPGLFESGSSHDVDSTRTALNDALTHSIDALGTMRENEGERLRQELATRLIAAEHLRVRILEQTAKLVETHRIRLKERLDKLLASGGVAVDHGRLEAELAILADRSDVTEELVRLQSHFEQFATLLSSHEAVGRRLDFLLQEIGRETNTVGSKCQDASLTGWVVDLKAEVERMREQVQNVE